MNRSWLAGLVAAVVVAVGVLTSVSLGNTSGGDADTRNAAGHGKKHDDKGDKGDKGHGREKADKGEKGDHGPPAWAHSKGQKLDKAERRELRQEWREEWRSLSPEEKRTLMDKLIRQHMNAMREFRMCQDDGRDDCELPFPPGLARRR